MRRHELGTVGMISVALGAIMAALLLAGVTGMGMPAVEKPADKYERGY